MKPQIRPIWISSVHENDQKYLAGKGARIFRVLIPVFFLLMLGACRGHDLSEEVYTRAEQAFSRGEYHSAEKFYQEYVQQFPGGTKRWEAWRRLVVIARDINKDNTATRELLAAVYLEYKTTPRRALAVLKEEVELCRAMGDLEECMVLLEKALGIQNLSPASQWDLRFLQGSLALRMNQFALAKTSFDTALALAPDDASRHRTAYALGQTLMYTGKYDQAREILEKTFAGAPPGTLWARTGFTLADIAEHDGRYADAVHLLDIIREHYPTPKAIDMRQGVLKEKIRSIP